MSYTFLAFIFILRAWKDKSSSGQVFGPGWRYVSIALSTNSLHCQLGN
jgi:hypothetical protein